MNTIRKNSIALSLLLLCGSQSWAQVTVFKDKNFSGSSKVITTEGEHLLKQSVGDKALSSVKVAPGWKVTLYDGYGDDPDTRELTSDAKDLGEFDNKANIIMIERVAGAATNAAPAPANTAASASMLKAGERLAAGQKLISANGNFILRMQEDDGNLCVYQFANGQQGAFVWGAMTQGNKNAKLVMQADGNLVVQDGSGNPKWASNTHPYQNEKFRDVKNKPVKLVLENDGSLKLYNAAGQVVWSNK
jgi:hypothetical protein